MDRYDPIRVLGEGSFGKVYLMRDKVKKNLVCIKIIKIKNIPKKEREATKVEVDLLRRLHHPNIVRYIDSFLVKNNDSLCICMEYCDGGDLASQIKAARRNLFSESKVLHWFVQIALGLHYMHNNKVLHRDLKTQNIFLLGNGRLVLGDLGISKVLDGTMDFAQTCIGTPYYMSPEIFKNKPYSYKSDVWALGCVLYEMTTLTHAFDANSLNGLAGKIIKGRYPPIHHKYSKFLRDLISDMLMTNPQQRPDLDQILRKPFIKKHIVNFFVDIMSRPTGSIGEGTMIVRAAVGGSAPSGVSNDSNMIQFKQQLQQLDMMEAVNEALAPKSAPADFTEAKKLAKEQMSALSREEDHKRMVEAALEKLRLERESRSKEKAGVQPFKMQPRQSPISGPRREDQSPKSSGGPSIIVSGMKPQVSVPINANKPSPVNVEQRREPIDAMAVIAREKAIERERRQMEDIKRRQQILQDQEARERSEERRREETRLEARAREEARVKEEARLREEAAMKQRQDQLRAQADAASRRDAQRQRERERQQEEIEQLRRDKLELDRRTQERDRVRNDRRADERRRLDENRLKESDSYNIGMQEKIVSPMNGVGPRPRNDDLARQPRAEEKEVSARDRVLQRKQEKLAKEEQDRLEALREAENANRLLRIQANQQQYNLYHVGSNIVTPKSNAGKGRFVYPEEELQQPPSYEFDSARKVRQNMDPEEMAKRLSEAVPGKQTRYDSYEPPSPASRAPVRPAPIYNARAELSDETMSEDDDDGESLWEEREVDAAIAEEAIHKREEELQAELQMTTLRLEELKRTLHETKSMYKGASPSEKRRPPMLDPVLADDEEEYLDDDDDYELNDTEEFEQNGDRWKTPVVPQKSPAPLSPSRRQNGPDFRHNQYENLQDAPVPSGRLSDRIHLLRQRCIDALGKESFTAAYNFLKYNQYDESHDDGDDEKMESIKSILGDAKVHFTSLIEQLIFMEESD